MDLTALVRSVRAIEPGTFAPSNVGRILRDVRLDQREVSAFPLRDAGYTRNLVYADPTFEIMVLRWARGAQTAIHDHADQQCWFTAVSGSFDVTNYRRISGGKEPGYARIFACETLSGISIGEPDYRYGETDIHRVTVSDVSENATSVHVYAKPVAACLVFDEPAMTCNVKQLAYHTVMEDRILLASA